MQARNYKPPLKGEGDQRSWWRGSAEIFTPVLGFTEETPQSAYGCQLPFQGSLLRKLLVCSRAAVSKPSGGIRSLPSLSAWGLPTPIVDLACIGNVDIQAFFLCKRSTLFCTAFASWWRDSFVYPPQQPADFTRSYASFFLY